MRGSRLALWLAALGGIAGPAPVFAGGADPFVIQGVGPALAPSQPPVARPVRVATTQSGLGGGFIEMLVTGGDPSPRLYAPPSADQPMRQPSPMQRAIRVAPVQRAAIDPNPAFGSRLQRSVEPRFLRQEVDYQGEQPAGSIIVDTPSRYLYYVLGQGRAIRYGIGVGRPGFSWAGVKTVSRKAEWPGWTPPAEMLLRRPELPKHMEGGPQNPLGARALYLGSSMYRIHGTNEPWTIGHNVSSGCIRMMNEDVIDLYERAKVGTRVQVI